MRINLLKFMTLFAVTILFSATTLSAQDATSIKVPTQGKKLRAERQQMTPEEKAEKRTARMTEHLGLSEPQATAIKAIHLKYIAEMDALRQQQIEDREEKMALLKDLREQEKAEIMAQLNEEQATTLQEFEAKRQERRGNRERGKMRGRRGPANH